MEHLKIKLIHKVNESYPIFLGSSLFVAQLKILIKSIKPTKIGIITDTHIKATYEIQMNRAFSEIPFVYACFPAGEESKSIQTVISLFDSLTNENLDRKSLIVAIGGGVTGDMAGFLASVYLRGIPFIQIPTSLLSMVDSSLGGKTGVDTPAGKNMMGIFNQPKAVIIDIDFLKTLPANEFTNGMAEVIKHAIIRDKKYFEFLDSEFENIRKMDPATLEKMIRMSCKIKAYVVQKDEKDIGLRQTLNFGHTIGHAIEKASNYRIPHGFSVALGMAAEGYISYSRGILERSEFDKINQILKKYSLLDFTSILREIKIQDVIHSSYSDKKNIGKAINAILIQHIGQVYRKTSGFSFPISEEEIKAGVNYLINA